MKVSKSRSQNAAVSAFVTEESGRLSKITTLEDLVNLSTNKTVARRVWKDIRQAYFSCMAHANVQQEQDTGSAPSVVDFTKTICRWISLVPDADIGLEVVKVVMDRQTELSEQIDSRRLCHNSVLCRSMLQQQSNATLELHLLNACETENFTMEEFQDGENVAVIKKLARDGSDVTLDAAGDDAMHANTLPDKDHNLGESPPLRFYVAYGPKKAPFP